MRAKLKIALLAAAALAVCACACVPDANDAQYINKKNDSVDEHKLTIIAEPAVIEPEKAITVTADGIVQKEPDIAYVLVGVQTEGAAQEEVLVQNKDKMAAVQEALFDLGVGKADIRTVGYSSGPKVDEADQTKVLGYKVSNTIEITVRDVSQAGEVLDACSAAGANIVNPIKLDYTDREGADREALKEAAAQAEAKAQIVAETSGIEIVGLFSMDEEYVADDGISEEDYTEGENGAISPIETGTIAFRARVTAKYEIAMKEPEPSPSPAK